MARGPGSNGSCPHPAGPHGRFPLPLLLVLAILPPPTGDIGDNGTSCITSLFGQGIRALVRESQAAINTFSERLTETGAIVIDTA